MTAKVLGYCDSCRFATWYKADKGECRRYPPHVDWMGHSGPEERYPHVTRYDWCGEWAVRDSADPINLRATPSTAKGLP